MKFRGCRGVEGVGFRGCRGVEGVGYRGCRGVEGVGYRGCRGVEGVGNRGLGYLVFEAGAGGVYPACVGTMLVVLLHIARV
jgi:hypothetical protein